MTSISTDRGPAPADSVRFQGELDAFRERLTAELGRFFAERRTHVAAYAPDAVDLFDCLVDLVTAGGKRLRPVLAYYAHQGCGGADERAALDLALATELLHAYLLVHDDIMDHATVRRGRPTAHVAFADRHRRAGWSGASEAYGGAVGILVGDLGYTYAAELASRAVLRARWQERLRAAFFAMAEEVIAGQHLELRVAVRGDADAAELERILRLKSGRYSVERPVELGALLAGAAESDLEGLRAYGASLGEAFQLKDDLLGMFGDRETVGKPVGTDLVEGKFTFLVFHALERATPLERDQVRATLGNAEATRDEVAAVAEIMQRTGAVDLVEEMIERRLEAAFRSLDTIELREPGATVLHGMIDYVGTRSA